MYTIHNLARGYWKFGV